MSENYSCTNCAAVGFADVTSANVVGYAQATARFGTKILGAQFYNIGGGEVDIQDLRPIGPYEGEYKDQGVYIQTLNENGVDTATYVFWKTAEKTGSRPAPARDGWYYLDSAFEKVTGVTFKNGEGIYFTAPSAEWSLQSSGGVLTTPTEVTLRFGTKMVVNPLPVPLDIQDIKIVAGFDPEGEYKDQGVYIQPLNENGVDTATYVFWKTAEKTGSRPAPARDGWYYLDSAFEKVTGVSIQPGEGVMFTAPNSDWVIRIPGVDLK